MVVANDTETCLQALEREQKALEPTWSRYELKHLMSIMEKMAGAPKEDGTYERQPGERNMYELSNELAYKARV